MSLLFFSFFGVTLSYTSASFITIMEHTACCILSFDILLYYIFFLIWLWYLMFCKYSWGGFPFSAAHLSSCPLSKKKFHKRSSNSSRFRVFIWMEDSLSRSSISLVTVQSMLYKSKWNENENNPKLWIILSALTILWSSQSETTGCKSGQLLGFYAFQWYSLLFWYFCTIKYMFPMVLPHKVCTYPWLTLWVP